MWLQSCPSTLFHHHLHFYNWFGVNNLFVSAASTVLFFFSFYFVPSLLQKNFWVCSYWCFVNSIIDDLINFNMLLTNSFKKWTRLSSYLLDLMGHLIWMKWTITDVIKARLCLACTIFLSGNLIMTINDSHEVHLRKLDMNTLWLSIN